MPLIIEPRPDTSRHAAKEQAAAREAMVIALVNNMPDSALEGTEAQFKGLLAAAAGERLVQLRYSSIPEVPRAAESRASIEARYWPLEDLFADPPDALIVTGTEPKTPRLTDEPYWARMMQLMEFAEARTVSSAWSCLAAHAAVLHLDGIERRRLPMKRFGVFDQNVLLEHPMTRGLSACVQTPHSRWNDVALEDLRGRGYLVLTASTLGEADLFVKERGSLFVFFQGHPEYEERTLLKEYQRDVGRFLSGEYTEYPPMPPGYFGAQAERLLREFEREACDRQRTEALGAFPFAAVTGSLDSRWLGTAASIYRNWLEHIASRKQGAHVRARSTCRA